jgi:hypothetical protein
MGKIIPKDIEVVVGSYGGVGTTFFLDFVSQFKKTNNPQDEDKIKHLGMPPVSFNKDIKCIYIYGDPMEAATSLFGRGMHNYQSKKLQRDQGTINKAIPLDLTLEDYAKAGIDQFQFRRHFFNWYQDYLVHPTLFIRYEKIWNHKEEIFKFLDLPMSELDNFPEKKERRSKLADLPEPVLSGLHTMYGGFVGELDEIGECVLRGEQYIGARMHALRSRNLRIALRRESGEWLNAHCPSLYQRVRNARASLVERPSPRS